MSTFAVIIPTFRETAKVEGLLRCFQHVPEQSLRVYIINGNPGDETSALLTGSESDTRIIELPGNPTLFWSGLVNIGLRRLVTDVPQPDYVVIMNVDIDFDGNLFELISQNMAKVKRGQLGALCHNGSRTVSSGTCVRSWMLALTTHPFAGSCLIEVPSGILAPVDYLPTRCTVIPMEAILGGGLVAEHTLPHYAADNEYTLRLKRLGYLPYIATDIRITCDMTNTGNSIYHKTPSLWTRLKNTTSIRSAYNFKLRSRFICLTYPFYARPTALIVYGLKGIAEVLLGGLVIRRLFRSNQRGFSGAQGGFPLKKVNHKKKQ